MTERAHHDVTCPMAFQYGYCTCGYSQQRLVEREAERANQRLSNEGHTRLATTEPEPEETE